MAAAASYREWEVELKRATRITIVGVVVSLSLINSPADGQNRTMPFTQSAHQLLAQARDEAQRLRHEYVGTEHLVLALTSQAENVAVRALLNQQIDLQRVRETVASIVSPGRAVVSADSALPYTTRTKQVLALAEESARELGRSDVGTEHILIGILREAMGIGGQALVHHGASVDAIIDEVRRMSDGG